MADQTASLRILVDATTADSATKQLDALKKKSAEVERATLAMTRTVERSSAAIDKLERSWTKATTVAKQMSQATAEASVQAQDATDSQVKQGQATQNLIDKAKELQRVQKGVGAVREAPAARATDASRSTDLATTAEKNLTAATNGTTAAKKEAANASKVQGSALDSLTAKERAHAATQKGEAAETLKTAAATDKLKVSIQGLVTTPTPGTGLTGGLREIAASAGGAEQSVLRTDAAVLRFISTMARHATAQRDSRTATGQLTSAHQAEVAECERVIATEREMTATSRTAAAAKETQAESTDNLVASLGEIPAAAAGFDTMADAAESAANSAERAAAATGSAVGSFKRVSKVASENAESWRNLTAAELAEEASLEALINKEKAEIRARQASTAETVKATQAGYDLDEIQRRMSTTKFTELPSAAVFMANMAALEKSLGTQSKSLDEVKAKQLALNEAIDSGNVLTEDAADFNKILAKDRARLTQEAEKEARALKNLLDKYDPATSGLKRLADEEKRLAAALADGSIKADRHAKAVAGIKVERARLEAGTKEVGRLSAAIDKLGLSSNQSTRDMATFAGALSRGDFGLAANQILQIGTRAGALRGIFNPLTLAITGTAVAVGTLIAAFIKGEKESSRFNVALQATGNYAGVTTQQLEDMVDQAAKGSEITATAARAVATSLVASGKLGAESIALITAGIGNFAIATGKTAVEASADLAQALEDPLDGILKLQKQYHFLSEAQFEAILSLTGLQNAMVSETDKEKARVIALEALNKHMDGMTENLGYAERSFRFAAKTASDFWANIKGIGREKAAGERIKELKQELDRLNQWKPSNALERFLFGGLQQREIARNQAELDREEAKAKREEVDAAGKAASARATQEAIEAKKAWDARLAGARTAAETLDFELKAIRETGEAAHKTDAEIKRLQGLAIQRSAPAELVRSINAQVHALSLQGKTTDEVAVATAKYSAAQAQLLAGYGPLTRAQEKLIETLGPATQKAALDTAAVALQKQGEALEFQAQQAERAAAVQVALANAVGGEVAPAMAAAVQNIDDASRAEAEFTLRTQLAVANVKMLPAAFEIALDAMADKIKRTRIAQAALDVANTVKAANIEILRETGHAAEAAALEIEETFKRIREKLAAAGALTPEVATTIDRQQEVREAAATRTAASAEMQRIQEDFGLRQQKLQLDIEAGLVSEIEARKQVIAMNKAQADELEKQIPILKEIADTTKSATDIAALERLRLKIVELRQNVNEFKQVFGQAFEASMADALFDIATNVSSLGDAVRKFILDLTQSMARWAAEGIANQIKTSVMRSLPDLGGVFGAGGKEQMPGELSAAGASLTTAGTTLTPAATTLQTGATTLQTGATTLTTGVTTLAPAATTLQTGSATLTTAATTLGPAAGTLLTAATTLQTAVAQLAASGGAGAFGLGAKGLGTTGGTFGAGAKGMTAAAPAAAGEAATGAATAAALTAAGTTVAAALTAAGTTAGGALTVAGTTTAGALTAAGTGVAGAITAAGTAAAASIAAAATGGSAASSGMSLAGLFGAGGGGGGGGFASGGYTGPGGKYDPAGVVHKGEYVFSQQDLAQPGMLDFLMALDKFGLRMLQGYAEGGPVAAAPSPVDVRSKSSLLVGLDDGLIMKTLSSDKGTELLVKKFARNPSLFRGALGLG